jgi:hypothetical protein
MNLLERLVNLFYPLEEQRNVEDAIGSLAPRFGITAAPLPVVERSALTGYRPAVPGIDLPSAQPTIRVAAGTTGIGYGEEAGHYLHHLANPALFAYTALRFIPADKDAALDYIALRNWEECIGRYAGTVYARERGEQHPPSSRFCRDWLKGQAAGTRMPSAIGEVAYLFEVWLLMTHVAGYRASDEYLAKDPSGASLRELSRLDSGAAMAELGRLRSWRRYWSVLSRQYGTDAYRALRLLNG